MTRRFATWLAGGTRTAAIARSITRWTGTTTVVLAVFLIPSLPVSWALGHPITTAIPYAITATVVALGIALASDNPIPDPFDPDNGDKQ